VAFTNEQHRKRYAEDPQHREHKLAANRLYRAEHRERLNMQWRERSNAAYRERHALTRIGRIYALSEEQYRRLLKEQKGVCAICRRPPRRRALCVDHCPGDETGAAAPLRQLQHRARPVRRRPGEAADRGGLSRACARKSDRPRPETPSAHAPRLGLMLDT
jgi:hypothetical protein